MNIDNIDQENKSVLLNILALGEQEAKASEAQVAEELLVNLQTRKQARRKQLQLMHLINDRL